MNLNTNSNLPNEGLPSHPIEYSENKPHELPKNLLKPVTSTAVDILSHPNQESSPLLDNKVTSSKPSSKIAQFFSRIFRTVNSEDKTLAHQVKEDMQAILTHLNNEADYAQQYAQTLKYKLKNVFPSGDGTKGTIGALSTYIQNAEQSLEKLKTFELTSKEPKIQELSEKYSTYTKLPTELKELEQRVNDIKNKLEMAKSLRDLEINMEKYGRSKTGSENRSWSGFDQIREKRREIAQELRKIVQNPVYSNHLEIQKYLKKEAWSSSDVKELMKYIDPTFATRFQKLADYSFNLQEKRLNQLSQQINILPNLFEEYRKQSKSIENLEEKIHSPSISNRIHRFFFNPSKLQDQLKKFKENLAKTSANIQNHYNSQFDSKELDWAIEVAKFQPLSKQIMAMRQSLTELDYRNEVSKQLYELQAILDDPVSTDENKLEAFQKLSHLSLEIKELYTKRGLIREVRKNPSAFDDLKVFIPLIFPTLKFRTESLFNKITKNPALYDKVIQSLTKTTIINDEPIDELVPLSLPAVSESQINKLEPLPPLVSSIVEQKEPIDELVPLIFPSVEKEEQINELDSLPFPVNIEDGINELSSTPFFLSEDEINNLPPIPEDELTPSTSLSNIVRQEESNYVLIPSLPFAVEQEASDYAVMPSLPPVVEQEESNHVIPPPPPSPPPSLTPNFSISSSSDHNLVKKVSERNFLDDIKDKENKIILKDGSKRKLKKLSEESQPNDLSKTLNKALSNRRLVVEEEENLEEEDNPEWL